METQTNFDELIKYNITDAVINELKDKYLAVKVTSFDDKENYEIAKRGHIEIKSLKADIEARRKELKEDSLKFGRMVDSKAKQVVAPLIEIEDHLVAQRNIIDLEVKRIKEEKEAQEEAMIESRMMTLAGYGKPITRLDARTMTEAFYLSLVDAEKINHENKIKMEAENAEKKRLWDEEQERQRNALEKERRELKAKEAEANRIIAEENKRLQDALEAKEAEVKALLEAKVEEVQTVTIARHGEEPFEIPAFKLPEGLVADTALMNNIMGAYPTLQVCWDEIFRLTKLVKELQF